MARNVTYGPQLIKMVDVMCNYITKHRALLNAIFTDPLEQAALNAIVAACGVFQAARAKYIP